MNYKGIKDKTYICLNCNKDIPFKAYGGNFHKYCNNTCQQEHQYNTVTLPRFRKGLIKDRITIKRILIKQRGHKCEICNLFEWLGQLITLETDHKDGFANNNLPENVRIICPNCHSQTPSWKGANKGKGRKSLRLPTN